MSAQSAQRTGMNSESKLLLLTHAFEQMQCIAVEFRTHWMNQHPVSPLPGLAQSKTECCATTSV